MTSTPDRPGLPGGAQASPVPDQVRTVEAVRDRRLLGAIPRTRTSSLIDLKRHFPVATL